MKQNKICSQKKKQKYCVLINCCKCFDVSHAEQTAQKKKENPNNTFTNFFFQSFCNVVQCVDYY